MEERKEENTAENMAGKTEGSMVESKEEKTD